MSPRRFQITATDPATGARTGRLTTAHGVVETPAFLPVGTQATVKTLTVHELAACGVTMLLANVYHLMLRPGADVIRAAGGLHRFMGWDGALLTDSGGFQVFSLSHLAAVTDHGVTFRSPIDGTRHSLTPESVMAFQAVLGSDVVVPLDECVRYPCERPEAEAAVTRTLQWAQRARAACPAPRQAADQPPLFFGIVQGATYPDLRRRAVEGLVPLSVDGYAIGGVSVGEPRPLLLEVLQATTEALPPMAPHYLMGVGAPLDLVDACRLGIDLFDCVVPTRHGRNGVAYTWEDGRLSLRHATHARDQRPLDPTCGCYACRHHSRSYLHHLVRAQELLGLRLLSLHNLWFYAALMRAIRAAIPQGALLSLRERLAAPYHGAAIVTTTEGMP